VSVFRVLILRKKQDKLFRVGTIYRRICYRDLYVDTTVNQTRDIYHKHLLSEADLFFLMVSLTYVLNPSSNLFI